MMARAAIQEICWALQARFRLRVRSVTAVIYHRSHYGSAQSSAFESVHMVKYSHPLRDHEELTGMDRRLRAFRKVCMASGKTCL